MQNVFVCVSSKLPDHQTASLRNSRSGSAVRHEDDKHEPAPASSGRAVSLWLPESAVTSAWKQLCPLGVVNSGDRRADLHFHFFKLCFSEQGSKNPRHRPKPPQMELTLAFNKTVRVAEDAWVRLSDGSSNLFDSGGKICIIRGRRDQGVMEKSTGDSQAV